MQPNRTLIKTTILIFFLLSGFCSLVYEVTWTRLFGLLFGNNTLAVSTVLSAFMLGLGLGALVLGKFSQKWQNPLRTYGILEIGIGVFALLIPFAHTFLQPFFFFIHRNIAEFPFFLYLIKFFISFLLMLPATFLMGGTLPVLVVTLIRQNENLGKEIGWLYGINTFGAVLGTFISGFFLIRMFGLDQSIFIAVALNLIIGVLAMVIGKSKAASIAVKDEEAARPEIRPDKKIWIYTIFAVSGFCALGYEVLWNRLLVFVMTNSVYAFTIMLTTFLVGIALGSGTGGRLADRDNRIQIFGSLQLAIAIASLFASVGLKYLPEIHDAIFVLTPTTTWWELNFIRGAEAFTVMIIPTVLMGISFPVASRIVVRNFQTRGQEIGKLYFYNTLGAMAGSFAAAFLFLPLIGFTRSVIILVLLNAVGGFYVFFTQKENASPKFKYAPILTIFVLIAVFVFTPKSFFQPVLSITEKDFQLIDFREGIEGTVTVHEKKEMNQLIRRIDVDGLNVAGTSFMLRTLQTLQGHLPAFVNPGAKHVVQIGFGTGQTSHCALTHDPQIFQVVEISHDVLDLSGLYFKSVNQDVFAHPSFKVTIADGKNFLRYTNDTCDIIMNDANYAVATASASLFTREHFENGRARLNKGGIFSTWMTTDLDPVDFQIVLKTFHSVFPHCLLWMAPNCINKQVVLMGSLQPFTFDFDQWQKMVQDEKINKDLQQININSAEDLLSCLVLDEDGIEAMPENISINTDNHPVLEFSTRAARARDFCAYQNLASILNYLPDLEKYVGFSDENSTRSVHIKKSLLQYGQARRELLTGMLLFYQGQTLEAMNTLLNGARMIPQSDMGRYYFEMMDALTNQLMQKIAQNPSDPGANLEFIRYQIGMGQYANARGIIRGKLKTYQHDPDLYYELGRCYVAEGKPDSALFYFTEAVKSGQSNTAVFYYLGSLQFRQNQFAEAEASFKQALQRDPRLFEAQNGLAEILQKQQRFEEAIQLYQKSLAVSAYQPEVYSRLGDCYLGMNQAENAIAHYLKAVGQKRGDSHTLFNLANAYHLKGDLKKAAFYYKETIKINKDNAEVYYNLGNTLAAGGDFTAAIDAFRNAIAINPDNEDYYNNLAQSYRAIGRINEAVQIFDQALKKFAKSKQLQENALATRQLLSGK